MPIELEIGKSRFIDQVVIYGENRKYITALIVPQREALEGYARENGIPNDGCEQLLARGEVRTLIADEIEKATTDCAPFEKVKAFVLLPEPFTVENELMTPTLKPRRSKITEKFAREIAAMYSGAQGG